MRHVARLSSVLLGLAVPAAAQDSLAPAPVVVERSGRVAVPFGKGERADYQVKFGVFSVGRGVT